MIQDKDTYATWYGAWGNWVGCCRVPNKMYILWILACDDIFYKGTHIHLASIIAPLDRPHGMAISLYAVPNWFAGLHTKLRWERVKELMNNGYWI